MPTIERENASVYAKIPTDLYEQLVKAAQKGRRSVAAQVQLLIERGLRKAKP